MKKPILIWLYIMIYSLSAPINAQVKKDSTNEWVQAPITVTAVPPLDSVVAKNKESIIATNNFNSIVGELPLSKQSPYSTTPQDDGLTAYNYVGWFLSPFNLYGCNFLSGFQFYTRAWYYRDAVSIFSNNLTTASFQQDQSVIRDGVLGNINISSKVQKDETILTIYVEALRREFSLKNLPLAEKVTTSIVVDWYALPSLFKITSQLDNLPMVWEVSNLTTWQPNRFSNVGLLIMWGQEKNDVKREDILTSTFQQNYGKTYYRFGIIDGGLNFNIYKWLFDMNIGTELIYEDGMFPYRQSDNLVNVTNKKVTNANADFRIVTPYNIEFGGSWSNVAGLIEDSALTKTSSTAEWLRAGNKLNLNTGLGKIFVLVDIFKDTVR